MGLRRSSLWLLAALTLGGLAGCGAQDEIVAFNAPAEPRSPAPRTPVRLLGALAPVPDEHGHWVFKVSGPEKHVNEVEPQIVAFLETVHIKKDRDENRMPVMSWKTPLPQGWREREGGGEFRQKTIDIPTGGEPLELTISYFPQRVRVLENINRWRGKIDRNPITTKEIPLVSRTLKMAESEATLVDIKGYEYTHRAPSDFEYDLPAGWRKLAGGIAFAKLAFKVEEGKKSATVTLTQAGGEPEKNLNRWRAQLRLPELGVAELTKTVQTLPVQEKDGLYVDYTAEDPGAAIERILGVIFVSNDDQWIAKMAGPKDLLEAEKPNFERFVRSLKPARK